jgi:hypothetical protein
MREGFLLKESETLKDWNSRYCRLLSRTLCTYDTEPAPGARPRQKIDLNHVRITLVDEANPSDFEHRGALLLETPREEHRLQAQRGQSALFFRPAPAEDPRGLQGWLDDLRTASREPWVPDSDPAAASCACCAAPFDALQRRHHCRRCGRVVCGACSPQTQKMPLLAFYEPVRVCRECFGQPGPMPTAAEAQRQRAEAERRAQAEEQRRREGEQGRRKDGASKDKNSEEAQKRRQRLREQFNVK